METTCAHCHGTGKQPISEERERCLAVIKQLGQGTRQEIHAAMKSKNGITATHQLIRRLVVNGSVKRVGEGRPMRFRVG